MAARERAGGCVAISASEAGAFQFGLGLIGRRLRWPWRQHGAAHPTHSITSSARNKIAVGNSMPIALAVLRFTANSNLFGCSIRMSPTLAPLSDVRGGLPMHGGEIGAVRQESSRLHVGPEDEHRGHPVLNRQLRDLGARGREMRARQGRGASVLKPLPGSRTPPRSHRDAPAARRFSPGARRR
jgi:hypothetical protein